LNLEKDYHMVYCVDGIVRDLSFTLLTDAGGRVVPVTNALMQAARVWLRHTDIEQKPFSEGRLTTFVAARAWELAPLYTVSDLQVTCAIIQVATCGRNLGLSRHYSSVRHNITSSAGGCYLITYVSCTVAAGLCKALLTCSSWADQTPTVHQSN
jgi:hypothetical protein